MRIKEVYTLIKSDVPEICNRQIVKDQDVGGIKLVYWRRRMMVKDISFGPIEFSYPVRIFKRKKVVFLRPYKDHWDHERNRLPYNYWGKTSNPLTNMWITVEQDYKVWSNTTVRFKDQVTDHSMIKSLKSIEETFSVFINQNKLQ